LPTPKPNQGEEGGGYNFNTTFHFYFSEILS
jgi:hypothetical protein